MLDFEVELPDAMISLIRLLMMPTDQWTKARDKGKVPKPTLDDAVLRIVQEVLEKRLAMYRTSIMVGTSGTCPLCLVLTSATGRRGTLE
jgi:SET domain-containing protein 6